MRSSESVRWIQLINEYIGVRKCDWDTAWRECPRVYPAEYSAMMHAGRTQAEVHMANGKLLETPFGGGLPIIRDRTPSAAKSTATMCNAQAIAARREKLREVVQARMRERGESYDDAFNKASAQLANSKSGTSDGKEQDFSVLPPLRTNINIVSLALPGDVTQDELEAAYAANGRKYLPTNFVKVYAAMCAFGKKQGLSEKTCRERYHQLAEGAAKGWTDKIIPR